MNVSLYCHTSENTDTVITAGMALTSMMRKYVYQVPAPSTNAASSISRGRPRKNWVKM